jgi:type IV pilus assembly protein PilN
MIRINLIPFRSARKKENVRRQISLFVLSVVLCVALLGGIYFYLEYEAGRQRDLIAGTKTELEKYEQINREIEEYKKKLETINKKLEVMRELEANRYEPVLLLDAMTQVVVEKRMWFTHLDTKPEAVNISGLALDEKTVSEFMVRLEQSGLFAAVNLRIMRQVEMQKTLLRSFEIVCSRKPIQRVEAKN